MLGDVLWSGDGSSEPERKRKEEEEGRREVGIARTGKLRRHAMLLPLGADFHNRVRQQMLFKRSYLGAYCMPDLSVQAKEATKTSKDLSDLFHLASRISLLILVAQTIACASTSFFLATTASSLA